MIHPTSDASAEVDIGIALGGRFDECRHRPPHPLWHKHSRERGQQFRLAIALFFIMETKKRPVEIDASSGAHSFYVVAERLRKWIQRSRQSSANHASCDPDSNIGQLAANFDPRVEEGMDRKFAWQPSGPAVRYSQGFSQQGGRYERSS
jgi:hypothetical protein